MLGESDCFGETAILTGARRNATATCASTECRIVSVAREDFLRLVSRSTVVHDDMQRVAARRRPDTPNVVNHEDEAFKKARSR